MIPNGAGAQPNDNATYKNITLIHNWCEDRHMTSDKQMTTTTRVFSTDVGGCPDAPYELATTKRAFDHSRLTSPAPAPRAKPSMYSSKNLEDRMATYGNPDALAYTMGKTVSEHAAVSPSHHMQTTNDLFYAQMPKDDTAKMPVEYFAPPGRTHYISSTVYNDTMDMTHLGGAEPAGSKGTRGEITRNPREAGNPYGVSVFVDEYSKWQTKLAGMPLEESVRKAQTKYF